MNKIMNNPWTRNISPSSGDDAGESRPRTEVHGGHRLMMIVCCVPMIIVVGILVFTGFLGDATIIYAVVCTAMMVAMMFAMPERDDQ